MAILRSDEIRKMEEKDLSAKLGELKIELAKEKANIRIGASVTSPGRMKGIKKTIARVETIKREKLLKLKSQKETKASAKKPEEKAGKK